MKRFGPSGVAAGEQTFRVSLVSMFAVAVAGLGPPPAATAATVTARGDRVHYVAAPGELNDVSLAYPRIGFGTRISDSGAVITALRPCRSIDAHTSLCPLAGVTQSVHLTLGDLDDRVTPTEHFSFDLVIDGGPGNDVLRGTDYKHGSDRLDGGGGQDELYGDGGADTLTDGDRDGAAGDAAPGPDTLDGGRGDDTLSYAQRTTGVRVRTGAGADAGERGEHDRVAAMENLVGGVGNDRLLGDRHDNSLRGRAGNDTIDGRDVGDELYGGPGDDRLFGGRGSDALYGGTGTDVFACGAGSDRSHDVQAGEALPRSCDDVEFTWDRRRFWGSRVYPTRTRTGSLSLSTECPVVFFSDYSYDPMGCHGTITVRADRGQNRLLARGSFSHGPVDGEDFTVPLARTAPGYRWSTGQLHPRATISVRIVAVRTPTRPFRWTLGTSRPG
jgi:hypothetical protein